MSLPTRPKGDKRRTGDSLRDVNTQQIGVNPRAVDKQQTDVNPRVVVKQWTDDSLKAASS